MLVVLLAAAVAPACGTATSTTAETRMAVDVALGDVSINKVPFLVAADAGLYAKHGLDVRQFMTRGAAEDARNSGVVVPPEYVREDISTAPIAAGGGAPMIYRAVNRGGIHRVIIATHENVVKSHIIGPTSIGPLCGPEREFRTHCARPHSGPSRAKRGKRYWQPAEGLRGDIKGRSPLAGSDQAGKRQRGG